MKRTIKGIRCDLGLTQEEMAKILEISIQSLRNKENYHSPLTATELMIIAEMAGIDPREIKLEA